MLTLTQLSALHRSHRDERVLSAYIDGSAPDPAAQRTWRLHLDRAIKDVRSWLDESPRAERDDFEHCVRLLQDSLVGVDPTVQAPGWVAFITRDGVIDAQSVPVAVPTRLVWSNGPCLAPSLRVLGASNVVVVAVVDARKAELYKYQFGAIERADTIRAHHVIEPPSHMGDTPRQGFHGGTRGSTGTDAAQQSLLESRDRMLSEAAERAQHIAGPTGWLVVGGIPSVAARLEELLAASAPERVSRLEHLDVHSPESVIAEAAKTGAATLRDARNIERVHQIVDRAASGGLGAVGEAATKSALAAESVHELFITRRYLEDHAPDAESAVAKAFDQAAAVEEVAGAAAELLDAHGGIGAELRFVTSEVSKLADAEREAAGQAPERADKRPRPRTKSTKSPL
jgi:Bacterial archaeo-eukaryotic release factor family 10